MDVPIKVLLAGDHPVVRLGLASQLKSEKDIQILGEAGNPPEVLKKAVELNPDVILLDVTTRGLNWPQAIALIKASLNRVRLLAFTISQTQDELLAAERAGASASLPNNFTLSHVLDMLRNKVAG